MPGQCASKISVFSKKYENNDLENICVGLRTRVIFALQHAHVVDLDVAVVGRSDEQL